MNTKQFMLVSGQQVICEVIEWAEKDYNEIVVRNCMEIVESTYGVQKIYIFKPWMHYQEKKEDLVIVNSNHVISIASPHESLLVQYEQAVGDMHISGKTRDKEFRMHMKELIDGLMGETPDPYESFDSDDSNVIPFPVH